MGTLPKSPQALIERCISDTASHFAEGNPKEAGSIMEFLFTGEDGSTLIPDSDVLEWMRTVKAKKDRCIAALRHLFKSLAAALRAIPERPRPCGSGRKYKKCCGSR